MLPFPLALLFTLLLALPLPSYTPVWAQAGEDGEAPTDPGQPVSVTLERAVAYEYVDDGRQYMALWVEATISAPGAEELLVSLILHYKDGSSVGDVVASLRELSRLTGAEATAGGYVRAWDTARDEGALVMLQPQQPGDLSNVRFVFAAIAQYDPNVHDKRLSDAQALEVKVIAYRDLAQELWNSASTEPEPLTLMNMEPPDDLKDMIEEGRGLPPIPSATLTPLEVTNTVPAIETAATITMTNATTGEVETTTIAVAEVYTVTPATTTTLYPQGEVAEEGEHETSSTPHISTTTMAAGVNVEAQGEYEYEAEARGEEEGEEEYGGGAAGQEAVRTGEEGEEREEEGDEGGEGEGEEREGANLPTREIAIAIVIAAVGGVALSFLRRK